MHAWNNEVEKTDSCSQFLKQWTEKVFTHLCSIKISIRALEQWCCETCKLHYKHELQLNCDIINMSINIIKRRGENMIREKKYKHAWLRTQVQPQLLSEDD